MLRWIGERVDAKSIFFALYLSAGAIKGSDPSAVPVDLTLLLGVIIIFLALAELIKKRAHVPGALKWILLLFAFLAWGAVLARNTEYGVEKVSRLFTLTFLAMTVPVVLFRTVKDLSKLINALVLTALIVTVLGLTSLRSAEVVNRMTSGSATTIMTGMLAGVASIGILVWGLEGKTWKFMLSIVGIGISALGLISAGSKGPIVALGLVLIYMFAGFYRRKPIAMRRLTATFGVAIFAVALAWQMLPSWSTGRLTSFFTGDFEQTLEGGRTEHYRNGIALIRNNPAGIGWGGYSVASGANGSRWYPHNFVIEITMEAGWGAGICILMLVGTALYRVTRITLITQNEQSKMLLALLIYFITAASFSGDINDHRWMLSILSISLASKSIFAQEEEQAPDAIAEECSIETSS